MAKRKTFISLPVVASVLTTPAIALAHNNDRAPLPRMQVRTNVAQQRPCYQDRMKTCVSKQYAFDFRAALARVASQRQIFENYGGMSSSSVTGRVASNDQLEYSFTHKSA
ncbi:hypothetical protein C7H84_05890 [Burkholderia sp. Nafp2/4-1b]|uniref:hypothetical protein n=1 Tax=Burkholderia sp. Nafp2/4-1b TaxID=2116686 RepID=UPI000F268405|nr:hypothetical protein [Burkholderia sp. Nafp2/4-1b]RKU04440.1 hypothetical protein C7H84_05890 [Burkholderia sp. Nafp2/4-1b]